MTNNIELTAEFPQNNPIQASASISEQDEINVNLNLFKEEEDPVYKAEKETLALKSDLPTKTSELDNDSDFATNSEVDTKIAAIPVPNVSGQIGEHNVSETAHADIRNDLNTEKTERQNADNIATNAISLKADKSTTYTKTETDSALSNKADITFVLTKISELVNGAPGTLDTLKEIADQLSNDESAASALTNLVSTLNTNLTNETNRAQGAEQALSDDIEAENSRATTVETVLSNAISTETTRAQNKENEIITSMVNPAVEGVYFGDKTTDGTWRIAILSGNISFQKRISGSWIEQGAFTNETI